ncbi:hypothetical protein NECAME_12289 [Necator americanus]|uniref:Uncharacterized protein n=1 Tax=Necator americanus TaxID=51031 RepID=W2T114_NECAM|nr:hypothetical protein NECAME_12289 [Necator americanus]ETN75588.1 hypothetical protein NECAME_12289 [Necator americanus]
MVRSRIELWHNSEVREAEPFIDDDVVYFINYGTLHRVTPTSGVRGRGLLELRVPMDGLSRHDELGEPLSLPWVPMFLRRSSWANFGVRITNYDFVEGPYRRLQLLPLRSLMLEDERQIYSKLASDHIFSSADVRFGS